MLFFEFCKASSNASRSTGSSRPGSASSGNSMREKSPPRLPGSSSSHLIDAVCAASPRRAAPKKWPRLSQCGTASASTKHVRLVNQCRGFQGMPGFSCAVVPPAGATRHRPAAKVVPRRGGRHAQLQIGCESNYSSTVENMPPCIGLQARTKKSCGWTPPHTLTTTHIAAVIPCEKLRMPSLENFVLRCGIQNCSNLREGYWFVLNPALAGKRFFVRRWRLPKASVLTLPALSSVIFKRLGRFGPWKVSGSCHRKNCSIPAQGSGGVSVVGRGTD